MVSEEWDISRVNEFCEKYGITLKIIYMETSEKVAGTVLAQNPKPDSDILNGDVLKVTIAKEPVSTTEEKKTTSSGESSE